MVQKRLVMRFDGKTVVDRMLDVPHNFRLTPTKKRHHAKKATAKHAGTSKVTKTAKTIKTNKNRTKKATKKSKKPFPKLHRMLRKAGF